MATAKKRSLSDMQQALAQPQPSLSHKQDDNDSYRMMVLRFEEPEEEVDRRFLQKAVDLGIEIPPKPNTAFGLIAHDVSTLDLSPTPRDSPEPQRQSSSPASPSMHTPSDSSIGSQGHRKTPSLAATSITSAPSITSATSHKSNYLKLKKGFRRISTMRRRKTLTIPAPELPLRPSTANLTRSDLESRSSIGDQIMTTPPLGPHAMTTEAPPMNRPSVGRRKIMPMPYDDPPPPPTLQPSQGPPPPPSPSPAPASPLPERQSTPPPATSANPAAVERSLSDPTLKKLRTSQLQEQLRFISFRASQTRLLRTKHLQSKRDSLAAYKQAQAEMEARDSEALTGLEEEHLSAEADLMKTLNGEKNACETRLRHMQAYCNPREHIEGMPKRVITKADYKKLEQQYHVKNGMAALHTSRINVLREKQAKQLEKILAKQEDDVEKLTSDFEKENADLDQKTTAQERHLNQEFAERKQRLISRWHMAEAIERRKLELESGEEYAPLPVIGWGDLSSDSAAEEEEMQRIISMKGISIDPETGLMVMEGGDANGTIEVGDLNEGGEYDAYNLI